MRIRSVKPEFMRHDELIELEVKNPGQYPMLVFIGLWMAADSKGVFEWKPKHLHLDILPFADFDFERTLRILESGGLIRAFQHEGKTYGHVVNFLKHQRLSGKEATEGGKHPEPSEYLPVTSPIQTVKHHGSNGEASGKREGSNGEAPGKHLGAQERERKGDKEKERNIEPRGMKSQVLPQDADAVAVATSSKPDLAFYHAIERGFLKHNGDKFTDYAKEGKAIHGLISKAMARDGPNAEDLLVSVCAQFWRLKSGTDKFWSGQPFLPSTLNASGVWDRVLESMRREELDPGIAEIIAEEQRLTGELRK